MRPFFWIPHYVAQVVADRWPLKLFAAGVAGAADYVLGGGRGKELALVAILLIVLDVITGIRASIHEGTPITSQKISTLFDKTFGYCSLVITAGVCAHVVGGKVATDLGAASILAAIITTEGLSVIENARRLGARLPSKLEGALTGALGGTKEQ